MDLNFTHYLFQELVSSNTTQRNWRGILIALLVIVVVLALIVTSVVLLTPPDEGPRVKGARFKLTDILSHEFQPLRFNGTWVSAHDKHLDIEMAGCDVSKAFDIVSHELFKSNLTSRFQIVKWKNKYSKEDLVHHGTFLELFIDNRLKWDIHTEQLIKKLNNAMYCVQKLIQNANKNTARTAYFANFHSKVFSAFVGFQNKLSLLNKEESRQKEAIRTSNCLRYSNLTDCSAFDEFLVRIRILVSQ
ncbi:unnamed protein product [Brassicogethes aeneus]|uniref:Uncharacterized protein n=1 Tax=Brassicogethes aeneus TaxID=1431903 RepID=A0A9P0B108_BRAAE|nr:unnamed protein product [Brassicogethes aeneus]